MIPDFRQFRGTQTVLVHSAKGSEWEKHKYVKKLGSAYYYPVGYDKGRTIDELEKSKKTGSDASEKEEKKKISDSSTEGTTDTKDWEKKVLDKVGKGLSGKELADLARTDFDKVLARIGIDWRKMDAEEVSKMQRQLVGKLDPNGKLEKKEEKKKAESRGKELDELLRKSKESKSSSKKKEETEEKEEEDKQPKKTYSLAARNRKRVR